MPKTKNQSFNDGDFSASGSKRTERNGDTEWQTYEDGPYCEVICTSPRVRTLDDLIREAKIDTEEWEITHWQANQWEQAQKNPNAPEDIRPLVVQLWQVKATMRKKYMEVPTWALAPVEIILENGAPAKIQRKHGNKEKRWLLWTDPHFSFFDDGRDQLQPVHDVAVLSALEQLMKQERFYGSVCLGDLLDLSEFSDKFLTLPSYRRMTQHSLTVAAQWLSRLNTHYLIEGNHDERIPRLLLKYNQAAYDLRSVDDLTGFPLLSVPAMLNLKNRQTEWVGNYPHGEVVIGDVHLFHGDVARKASEATARAYLGDCNFSVAFGHIHRLEKAERYEDGKQQVAVAVGCCCRIDGVVPGHNPRHQRWQQGGAVLTEFEDGSTLLELVPVIDGVATWHGKQYSAKETNTE